MEISIENGELRDDIDFHDNNNLIDNSTYSSDYRI